MDLESLSFETLTRSLFRDREPFPRERRSNTSGAPAPLLKVGKHGFGTVLILCRRGCGGLIGTVETSRQTWILRLSEGSQSVFQQEKDGIYRVSRKAGDIFGKRDRQLRGIRPMSDGSRPPGTRHPPYQPIIFAEGEAVAFEIECPRRCAALSYVDLDDLFERAHKIAPQGMLE